MKLTANELADRLEQKARTLRDSGLTEEDMKLASGGGCTCCGSSCQYSSAEAWESCSDTNARDLTLGSCVYSCISSSPD